MHNAYRVSRNNPRYTCRTGGGVHIVYHETIRDIHAAQGGGYISCITKLSEIYALHEGGLRVVDHEMFRDLLAVVSMHISEPQSRTFPLYMTFWQLHSILYLEKSRDIWDSVLVSNLLNDIMLESSPS